MEFLRRRGEETYYRELDRFMRRTPAAVRKVMALPMDVAIAIAICGTCGKLGCDHNDRREKYATP